MKRFQFHVLAFLVAVLTVGFAGVSYGSDTAKVTILQTADLHNHASGYGPFLDYPENDTVVGGYARLGTLINDIRGEGNDILLIDSGDFLMGTPYDITDLTFQFFQMMQYDAVTLGNHEFDWTPDGLARIISGAINNGFANVPILASNMYNYEETELDGLVKQGVIKREEVITLPGGLTVGILGVMGPGAQRDAPMHPPLEFNFGPDLFGNYEWDYDAIQDMVDDLRGEVDLVIVLSHSGINSDYSRGDDIDLAKNVAGIDIIASGHAHTLTDDKVVVPHDAAPWETIIFSPGEYGEALSRLDLTFNIASGSIEAADFTLISVDNSISPNPAVQVLVDGYNAYINGLLDPLALEAPISHTQFDLTKGALNPVSRINNLGSLCADAVRVAAYNYGPADVAEDPLVAVVARGVIRDNIRASQAPGLEGVIPFSDIYTALPLGISPNTQEPGYPLMALTLTPFELYLVAELGLTGSLSPAYSGFYLNFSGIQVEYDIAGAEAFSGVQSVSLYDPSDIFCEGPPGEPLNRFDAVSSIHATIDLYGLELLDVANGLVASQFGPFPGPFPPEMFPADRTNYIEPQAVDFLWADEGVDIPEYQALMAFLQTAFPYPEKTVDPDIYGDSGSILNRIKVAQRILTYIAVDHGSIEGESSQVINHGLDGTKVTAIPDPGYYFLQWDDGSTDNPRLDQNVTEDLTLTAEFAEMARVVLYGEEEVPVTSNARIIGTSAKETLNVEPGISIVFTAGHGDRVNLPHALTEYTITARGNQLFLIDPSGNRITLFVNGASIVGFADGDAALDMVFPTGERPYVVLGGSAVTDTPIDHEQVVFSAAVINLLFL